MSRTISLKAMLHSDRAGFEAVLGFEGSGRRPSEARSAPLRPPRAIAPLGNRCAAASVGATRSSPATMSCEGVPPGPREP